MSVLSAAAVLALVVGPQCGGLLPPGELADRIAGIAMLESGGDPLAIGVNPDRARGLAKYSVHPRSLPEAVATARSLLASGRTFGVGLAQIDSPNLARHGLLSLEAAFDQCRNLRAGIEHYSADVEAAAIYRLGSQRYNTGGFDRGQAYARGVELAVQRVRLETGGATIASDTLTPTPTPAPQPPPAVMVSAMRDGGPPVPVLPSTIVDAVIHKEGK